MENKDIILFILTICVIYLLYCNKKNRNHESFVSGSIRQAIIDEVEARTNQVHNESITESIKNLGLLAKEIQQNNGAYRFPANLTAEKFIVSGNSEDAQVCIKNTCIDESDLIKLKRS